MAEPPNVTRPANVTSPLNCTSPVDEMVLFCKVNVRVAPVRLPAKVMAPPLLLNVGEELKVTLSLKVMPPAPLVVIAVLDAPMLVVPPAFVVNEANGLVPPMRLFKLVVPVLLSIKSLAVVSELTVLPSVILPVLALSVTVLPRVMASLYVWKLVELILLALIIVLPPAFVVNDEIANVPPIMPLIVVVPVEENVNDRFETDESNVLFKVILPTPELKVVFDPNSIASL